MAATYAKEKRNRIKGLKGAVSDHKRAAASFHMQSALGILQGKLAKLAESFR
jgi:hypothetical protein